ncbi:MAG: hypothetical protein WBQ45_10645, partial [Roseiarcus sp.]
MGITTNVASVSASRTPASFVEVKAFEPANCRSAADPASGFAAGRRAARPSLFRGSLPWLFRSNERAHEPARDGGRNGVHVDAIAGQEFTRVVDLVDA